MQSEITLKSPIFALYVLNDFVIVASGGGNAKFGVKNTLQCFQLSSSGISASPVSEQQMGNDVPVYISGLPSKNIFCISVNNFSIFYSISKKGDFSEIYKIQSLPTANEDLFQSCLAVTPTMLCTGASNGNLKVFSLKFQNNDISAVDLLKENTSAHIRTINSIIVIPEKKILITASGDGTCKMFEIATLKMLKKISFRASIEESSNYFMRDIQYDSYNNVLYTLQSPLRGKSFITKWDMYKGLSPISTIEVNDIVCSAMDYNKNTGVIGVVDCEGHLIYIDTKGEMKKIKKLTLGENMIKCGAFYGNQFISGSVDNILRMSKSYTSGLISIGFLFKIILIGLVVFHIYNKANNIF